MESNIKASDEMVKCTENYSIDLRMELKILKIGKEMNKYKIKMD